MNDRPRLVAPNGTLDCSSLWAGRLRGKSWEYRVTAVLPHLQTPAILRPPDTETTMNLVLCPAGVAPLTIGTEAHLGRTVDDNVSQVRMHPGSRLFGGDYSRAADEWMREGIEDAWNRIKAWGQSGAPA